MTTYPLQTLAAQVSETGIAAPNYNDILESLKASYRGIYGSDVYLEADSQDGQLLAIFASAINDANAAAIAVYNAFSPATAKGVGLSRVVKINGIARKVASNSTVDVLLVGQVGTTILNGQVGDGANNRWALPLIVTIPDAGEITVTATCTEAGAVTADPDTVTKILTPTLGWQTVTNAAAATAGQPVETDAQLRQRQAKSVARPSLTALEGLIGEVAAVQGVKRLAAYENDTNSDDGNGIPPHALSLVVDGGDTMAVAQAIASKKTPGAYTYGTTSVFVPDMFNVPHTIRFYRPTVVEIDVAITIHALTGYTSSIGDQLKAALAAYITGLDIGADVMVPRLYVPAQLAGLAAANSFEVTSLEICIHGGAPGTADITIAFNEAGDCVVANIDLTVT